MIKCQQCREKDVQLLTTWERFKAWLFQKVNSIFFTDEFEDLKTQKYTQGYSDGNTEGFKQGFTERKLSNLEELWTPKVPKDDETLKLFIEKYPEYKELIEKWPMKS